MKIKIQTLMDGNEILQYFIDELKKENIEPLWKEGQNPNGIKILVTNKNGEDVEISPDKIKIAFNKE